MNLEHVKQFVLEKLGKEASGHDYLHALRVLENAKQMTPFYDVKEEVVFVSCLIHDLIDIKLEDQFKVSVEDLKLFLLKEGMIENDVEMVIEIIDQISYSKGTIPKTLEGIIVQDSDRLDALGAIGIARAFAFGGKNNRLIYNPKSADDTDSVSHFFQKLFKLTSLMNTDQGRIEAEKRTQFMKGYLRQLYHEINKEDSFE